LSAPTFDLQSHSIYSDGELSPTEVVGRAAQAGVELVSLTDHDSVDGVREAQTAARDLGIACISGVEISCIYSDVADLHLLGYAIDITNPALISRLAQSRDDRENRAGRMVEALGELGYAVDQNLLRARVASGKTVGRPHIAQAVVSHPDNAERLAAEGLTEPSAFLVAYLIEGRPAFRARQAPEVQEAVELIHAAGGVAVWAHPFWDFSEPVPVLAAITEFIGFGLDGVEAFYVTHTAEQTELLAAHCAQLGLLTTGSSDFHGPGHQHFNRFRAFQTYGLSPRLGPLAPVK
jgi:predicted metal-dependent phosphoesterase TrpH